MNTPRPSASDQIANLPHEAADSNPSPSQGELITIAPLKLGWIEALSVSDDTFSEQFGFGVAPGWIGFPKALPFALEAARANDEDEWGPYLFFDDDVLVGFGGFEGPSNDGTVEIGYAIAPSWQGRGAATAATRLFLDRAGHRGMQLVIAHTLPRPTRRPLCSSAAAFSS